MLDLLDFLTFLGIGCLSVLIPGYISLIYIKNNHLLEDIITNGIINVINDAQNDETLQKNIYTIGAIIGNGVANGSGMKGSAKGGKLSLNNLIAEIASNWIQQSFNNPSSSSLQTPPPPNTGQKDKFFNT